MIRKRDIIFVDKQIGNISIKQLAIKKRLKTDIHIDINNQYIIPEKNLSPMRDIYQICISLSKDIVNFIDRKLNIGEISESYKEIYTIDSYNNFIGKHNCLNFYINRYSSIYIDDDITDLSKNLTYIDIGNINNFIEISDLSFILNKKVDIKAYIFWWKFTDEINNRNIGWNMTSVITHMRIKI